MSKSLSLSRVIIPDSFFDVPTEIFDIYVEDIDAVVGRIEYRHETGQDLIYYGNIGYLIYHAYRGHNYAYHACVALLEMIDAHIDVVYITCNPDNIASKKTIEKLKAVHLGMVDIDPKHELYRYGEKQKEVYIITRDGEYETIIEAFNK